MDYGVDLGKEELTEEDHDKIIEATTKIIETRIVDDITITEKETWIAHHDRGISYYSKMQFDKAIQDFSKAIELMPDDDSAYFMRAASYYMFYRHDEALMDAKKALEFDKTNEKYQSFVSEITEILEKANSPHK